MSQYPSKFTSMTILHPLWFMATFTLGALVDKSTEGRISFGISINVFDKHVVEEQHSLVDGAFLSGNKPLKIWPEEHASIFSQSKFQTFNKILT